MMLYQLQEILVYFILILQEIDLFYVVPLIMIFSLISYSLPLPGSINLFFHIIFFGLFGFFTSLICAIFSSIFLYILFKKYIKIKKIKKFKFIKKNLSNIYVLTLCRIFIPFPICSYFFIFFNVEFKKYIFVTVLGSIPGTASLSLLIFSLKTNLLNHGHLELSVFTDPVFIISIFFIVFLIYLSKIFKRKFT